MTRLRVDRCAVTSRQHRFSIASSVKCFVIKRLTRWPPITKSLLALLVSFSLLATPVWATPSSSLGTVVYADRAHVGAAQASVGATLYSGDRLSTDQSGSVQVRAGAPRLLLSSASSPTFSQDDATPAATLTLGSAIFSAANSNAFALHVASAVIRPYTNHHTLGHVTVLHTNTLIVKST